MHPSRPLVICPLEFERKALQRALPSELCEVHCCGPGAAAIARWFARIGPAHRPIILAGLAGALVAGIGSGSACTISEVIDPESGSRERPTLSARAGINTARTITSLAKVALNQQAKAQLHQQTGAELVDLESVAFAHAAISRGWPWAIVRGVSDDLRASLPREIDEWVDDRGRARPLAITKSLVRRPTELRALLRLGTASRHAMKNVAGLIVHLLSDLKS